MTSKQRNKALLDDTDKTLKVSRHWQKHYWLHTSIAILVGALAVIVPYVVIVLVIC